METDGIFEIHIKKWIFQSIWCYYISWSKKSNFFPAKNSNLTILRFSSFRNLQPKLPSKILNCSTLDRRRALKPLLPWCPSNSAYCSPITQIWPPNSLRLFPHHLSSVYRHLDINDEILTFKEQSSSCNPLLCATLRAFFSTWL